MSAIRDGNGRWLEDVGPAEIVILSPVPPSVLDECPDDQVSRGQRGRRGPESIGCACAVKNSERFVHVRVGIVGVNKISRRDNGDSPFRRSLTG